MINRIQLLRNIGQFDSVTSAANIDLGKLTLIYAENGRGKTTLSAILRSLATGEALPILERQRLGSAHAPEVIMACAGGLAPRFQNGTWTQTYPNAAIFDDSFIDSNVHSGLDVDATHRQGLHDLILGEQGVLLARGVSDLAQAIRDSNATLKVKTAALQGTERQGLSLDKFCAVPVVDDAENAIVATEQRLASLEEADAVGKTDDFSALTLPNVDLEGVRTVLSKTVADLDAQALVAVQGHLARLGKGGEKWISSGMDFAEKVGTPDAAQCPFCLQALTESEIFASYRAHFSEGYKELVAAIEKTKVNIETTLRGDALAGFGRRLSATETTRNYWTRFCTIAPLGLDQTHIASAWQDVRDALTSALASKQTNALAVTTLDAAAGEAIARYTAAAESVSCASALLQRTNEDIARVKEQVRAGNVAAARSELAQLRASVARHKPEIAALCNEYVAAKRSKDELEAKKASAQSALDAHRAIVFAPYQSAINKYLVRFNAGFAVEQVQSQNAAGTPSCSYQLSINAHSVPLAATSGPRFKNTLSAGDRNTLALAFFFASLDCDPAMANKVVIIDDPVSSLDEHRTLATVQACRGLADQVGQVILLSHSKPFLAQVWRFADKKQTVALEVVRDGNGSTIETWNVNDDSVNEYDRLHKQLREFACAGSGVLREVAKAIRPVLEGYLRVTCAADFPPGKLLGQVVQVARDKLAAKQPILSEEQIKELAQLIEYANQFHHNTNPAWDTQHINDGELRGFVGQTLTFVAARR